MLAMVGGQQRRSEQADHQLDALVIDRHEIRCGGVSVGLPPSCSVDTVLRCYGELLRSIGSSVDMALVTRRDDLAALGRLMGLTADAVRNRLVAVVPAAA